MNVHQFVDFPILTESADSHLRLLVLRRLAGPHLAVLMFCRRRHLLLGKGKKSIGDNEGRYSNPTGGACSRLAGEEKSIGAQPASKHLEVITVDGKKCQMEWEMEGGKVKKDRLWERPSLLSDYPSDLYRGISIFQLQSS